jgi:polar amino acid transport system substrate-binding protein
VDNQDTDEEDFTFMQVSRTARLYALIAMMVAIAALAIGCGTTTESDGEESSGGATKQEQDAAIAVPDRIKEAGVLKIGTDASYPPFESIDDDGKTVVGLDPDLAKALGETLGVKVEMIPTAWDGIIPALRSQRFDLIMSAMDDTVERQEQVDYVDYMNVPAFGMLVPKGNPKGLKTLEDLCGQTVAVQKGTTQSDYVEEESKKCAEPMKVRTFPTEADAQLQVQTGRAVADVTDQVVAVYVSSSKGGGKLESVELPDQPPSIKGIAVRKDDTELRDAVQAGLTKLAETGAYQDVLKKWGFPDGAVDEFTVNGVK